MSQISPFRALRPRPSEAARVAAVPYDVVSTDEARGLADGNPSSFLRVSRAELELPDGTDPYSDAVYERARANFERLRKTALVVEDEPSLYFYRLQAAGHSQTGLAACFSLDEYDRDEIKKHERTRRDKEDDRTRHMIALGAQTGPVFLTYRSSAEVDGIALRTRATDPLLDFEAPDGVRHTLWRASGAASAHLATAFGRIPVLYIADGHHRAASAARARALLGEGLPQLPASAVRSDARPNVRDEAATMLAVAFPDDQVRILPYNRIVRDLGGLSPEAFLERAGRSFDIEPGPPAPQGRGLISMYVDGTWRTLRPRSRPDGSDPIGSLDVSILQDQLLAPVLGIRDVRTDKRIDFVGGIRGTGALRELVDSGQAAAAFSLHPVTVADLMAVADRGDIMPPKSTWFEPKLRDGLLIHLIP